MVKFSIIVPVYNVENYLRECIESILGQSFINYELILVNDGSTDKSGLICDEFAVSNNNIIVIHKKNGGLSDARNAGLEKAKGQYIIFIDSDDFIELGTFEKFNLELNNSNNPDILITRLKQNYENGEFIYMDNNMPVNFIKDANKGTIVQWIFSKSNNSWPAVRYVVKRSLIEKHNLKFLKGYLHEDIDWTSRIFLYALTFTCCEFYWYNHRKGRQNAITTNKNAKRTLDVINLVSKNIKDIEYNKIQISLRNLIFQRMVKSLFASLSYHKSYKKEEYELIVETLYRNQEVFSYTIDLRHKVFTWFSKIFGFSAALLILRCFKKISKLKFC